MIKNNTFLFYLALATIFRLLSFIDKLSSNICEDELGTNACKKELNDIILECANPYYKKKCKKTCQLCQKGNYSVLINVFISGSVYF